MNQTNIHCHLPQEIQNDINYCSLNLESFGKKHNLDFKQQKAFEIICCTSMLHCLEKKLHIIQDRDHSSFSDNLEHTHQCILSNILNTESLNSLDDLKKIV